MSVISAYQFIQESRRENSFGKIVFDDNSELATFVGIGKELGFEFSVEDLRKAFKYDWGIRRHLRSISLK